jgi:hypothetical protein
MLLDWSGVIRRVQNTIAEDLRDNVRFGRNVEVVQSTLSPPSIPLQKA